VPVAFFYNYAGQTMLDVCPQVGSNQWCDFYKYSSDGLLLWHASPSAVSGYDDTKADLLNSQSGNYQYLRDNSGLIRTYTYHAPTGYLASESIQQRGAGHIDQAARVPVRGVHAHVIVPAECPIGTGFGRKRCLYSASESPAGPVMQS
jgi:hypothetical protein